MDEQVKTCKEKGFVRTILGRKRRISEITASNYMVRQLGERLAMNSPIQGSAADIIKIAMVKAYEALKPLKSRLILQVHDELIIETDASEKEQVKRLLAESMENAVNLSVKLAVDFEEGSNWYELKYMVSDGKLKRNASVRLLRENYVKNSFGTAILEFFNDKIGRAHV